MKAVPGLSTTSWRAVAATLLLGSILVRRFDVLPALLTIASFERLLQRRGATAGVLGLLGVDEQAHHGFFLKAVRLFPRHDREGTLRQLRRVLHSLEPQQALEVLMERMKGTKSNAEFLLQVQKTTVSS